MVLVKILVDHIKDTPLSIHIDEPVASFPLLTIMQEENNPLITGSIKGDLVVTREFDTVRVTGRVTAPLALSCSRCLVEFSSFVDTNFTIFYRKELANPTLAEEDLELAEMDLLSSTYTGNEIDFTHEIEEQIAMEIPLKPLCTDSCKGLCHECGIDLNTSSCLCNKEPVNITFSALKNFKVIQK